MLGPLAIAALVTVMVVLAAGGASDTAWIAAVLWAILASFAQALRQGMRHGDWSAFSFRDLPSGDDELDFCTQSGRYAYRRIRRRHETLMRQSDHPIENRDLNLFP